MRNRKWIIVLLMTSVILLAVTGCASSGPSVNVDLTSFKIATTPTSIASGIITFHIKNNATDVSHDLVIVKTDLAASSLPTQSNGQVDLGKLTVVGQIQPLAPGASQDLTINNMASGHYVLFCNVVGHYAAGMYAEFVVN